MLYGKQGNKVKETAQTSDQTGNGQKEQEIKMSWSVKAILARFSGNKTAAMLYCAVMSTDYPNRRAEYDAYYKIISAL
jgi:hypothetical protein